MEQLYTEKRGKLRVIFTCAAFLLVIFGLFIANLIYTPPELSYSERRKLATFKAPTVESVLDRSFMQTFDNKYSLDSFVLRDSFRSLKSFVQYKVLNLRDSGGIYVTDGHAVKLETLNQNSVSGAGTKIEKLSQMLQGLNLYYSVIPDKGYYLAEDNGYPSMDYTLIRQLLADKITSAEYIDIFGALEADDYYTTDLHWDQSKLNKVVSVLADKMGFEAADFDKYTQNHLSPFYGVYRGQSALPLAADKLTYLTDDAISRVIVKLLDTKTLEMTESQMYDLDSFTGIDPYNVYLSGAQALITIENPNAATDKQLYIFRDSYSSSLAPLLTDSYAKITLIDLRYIASPMLSQFVEFEQGSDVLFLYGTLILNNSETLQVG